MIRVRRLLARAMYAAGPVCFACGRRGAYPRLGHEYGGTIIGYRARAGWPWLVQARVDPRWRNLT